MINRMVRATKLDESLYREVEKDTTLTREALQAVILVSVLSGLGSGLAAGLFALIFGALIAALAYLAWAWVTYKIGTSLFKGRADYGELRRTLGYAYAPNALTFFRFLPGVGGLIATIATIWSLVAGIVAIRVALEFDTGKAVLTVLVGWLAVFFLAAIPSTILFLLFSGR